MSKIRISATPSTDAARITRVFTAGEGITAGQLVMISDVADGTVLIATGAGQQMLCGVALNDAVITALVEVCLFGVVEVTAGANITRQDRISSGATAGRVYPNNSMGTGAGSAHTHADTFSTSQPSATISEHGFPFGSPTKYCANSSGGSPTQIFYACTTSFDSIKAGTETHTHTINGAITNESAHSHQYYDGRTIGKALESFTTGNTGLVLIGSG